MSSPLAEEQLSAGRRSVETDRVRVRTVADEHDVLVEEVLRTGSLDVTRVKVDREVAEAPTPYRDGNTLIIPIVEERLVVEKRLFVVEEVRVTGSSHEEAVSVPDNSKRGCLLKLNGRPKLSAEQESLNVALWVTEVRLL